MLCLFHYFNLLSIDAVLVALAWQEVLARTVPMQLSWQERALLGISVWVVYVVDHLLDASRKTSEETLNTRTLNNSAPRHCFVKNNSVLLLIAIGTTLLLDLVLAFNLPWPLLLAGMALGALTGAYLLLNTFLLARGIWPRGKEVAIAVIFSLGCGLISLVDTPHRLQLFPWIIALALLGTINCILIARMERGVPLELLSHDIIPSPGWLVLLGALLFLTSRYYSIPPIAEAVLISLFGLSLIPKIAKRFGYETASLATDGALFLGACLTLLN